MVDGDRHRKALEQAHSSLRTGRAQDCIEQCDQLLEAEPGLSPARFLRGLAHARLGRWQAAAADFTTTLQSQPNNRLARLHLAGTRRRLGEAQAALALLDSTDHSPDTRFQGLLERALCLRDLGRRQEAAEAFRQVLAIQPDQPQALVALAVLEERLNHLPQAARLARRALEVTPGNVAASLTLATVQRRQGDFATATAALSQLLKTPSSGRNRAQTHHQLAQCLDRSGDYDQAFSHFQAANRTLAEASGLGPEPVPADAVYSRETSAGLLHWFRSNPPESWSPAVSDDEPAPVFFMGFPRSGTTLLDQMLNAHPQVRVIEEQELLEPVRQSFLPTGDPTGLEALGSDALRQGRELYRQAVRQALPDGAVAEDTLVVDKLPLHTIYLGFIRRFFPDARVLFALRDPRDVCLSCFFQLFNPLGPMPYFMDLRTTVDYYDAVMTAAGAYRQDGQVQLKAVCYEDLVSDTETILRQVVAFLGLEWHPQLLAYRDQARQREIHTPSYESVVEPIYRRAVQRWRHYEAPLAPVRERLDWWAGHFGYTD